MNQPIKQNQQLRIGQVIYVLSNKGQEIIPAMVVEEQTIQTMQGTSTSWKIAIGSGTKQRVVDSTKLNAELYSSLEEVKALLTTRLNKFIDGLISTAQKRETVWYGKIQKEANKSADTDNSSAPYKQTQPSKIDPESLLEGMDVDTMDFDDTNHSQPSAQMQQHNNVLNFNGFAEKERAMSVKEKLRESIMPSDDELRNGSVNGARDDDAYDSGMTITGPDGRPMKVNIKV